MQGSPDGGCAPRCSTDKGTLHEALQHPSAELKVMASRNQEAELRAPVPPVLLYFSAPKACSSRNCS